MRLKKKSTSIGILGKILNVFSNSQKDTYSCDYINNMTRKTLLWEGRVHAYEGVYTLNNDFIKYDELVFIIDDANGYVAIRCMVIDDSTITVGANLPYQGSGQIINTFRVKVEANTTKQIKVKHVVTAAAGNGELTLLKIFGIKY